MLYFNPLNITQRWTEVKGTIHPLLYSIFAFFKALSSKWHKQCWMSVRHLLFMSEEEQSGHKFWLKLEAALGKCRM